MTHTEFARLLENNGFMVSAKALAKYAETGSDRIFPYQLRLWLEDYHYENGHWSLDIEG